MSFKQLEDEHIEHFNASQQASKIEQEVQGTLNVFRFMGTIFDVYLNRFKDVLVEMGKQEGVKNDLQANADLKGAPPENIQ
ncbi:MAG: hypothetical protein AAF738_00390 [Bacteroidota bacterium]